MSKITLNQFMVEERERLARFHVWYLAQSKKPENVVDGEPMFPLRMEPGEWDQQLLAFEDDEEGEE